eukprot:83284-Pleurochrysis_carterae.AAC.3
MKLRNGFDEKAVHAPGSDPCAAPSSAQRVSSLRSASQAQRGTARRPEAGLGRRELASGQKAWKCALAASSTF